TRTRSSAAPARTGTGSNASQARVTWRCATPGSRRRNMSPDRRGHRLGPRSGPGGGTLWRVRGPQAATRVTADSTRGRLFRRSGATSGERSSRPYWAARLEDSVNRRLGGFLRSRGWWVRVEPFTSYGTEHKVRILARVVYSKRPSSTRPRFEYMRAVRGWRNFTSVVVPHAEVTVEGGGHVHTLTADRAGVVDAIVDASLTPGWNRARITDENGETTVARILCVDRGTTFGVVSDIDDTVMVAALPRHL